MAKSKTGIFGIKTSKIKTRPKTMDQNPKNGGEKDEGKRAYLNKYGRLKAQQDLDQKHRSSSLMAATEFSC